MLRRCLESSLLRFKKSKKTVSAYENRVLSFVNLEFLVLKSMDMELD